MHGEFAKPLEPRVSPAVQLILIILIVGFGLGRWTRELFFF